MISLARALWPYALLLLIGIAAGWWATNNHWSAKYDKRSVEYAEATTRAEQAARATESMWRSRSDAISRSHQRALLDLADTVAASAGDNERLRQQLAERNRRASSDSNAAGNCEAIRGAASLYAELLTESDRLAGEYAAEADRRGIIANACAAHYDSLTAPD